MPNHLIHENSPYLLQHAHNPVDWYPWGEESLSKARTENRPIFLSIGYAACHWCHVMAHESFEDPETAALLNANFVCIKVDREQRPDLDNIYMQATNALTGSGGWPMSVFLTPDLRPFYAGTYFPPVRRYNMPAFKEVLLSVLRLWREDPAEIGHVGEQVTAYMQAPVEGATTGALSHGSLDGITKSLLDSYDWGYGGWGSAPKFPQPMTIEFLLRRAVAGKPFGVEALKAACHVLDAMARGGMYDVVGGGFSRYSTDNFWRVPHFEKMLYDNALLARTYLHAWQITQDPSYKQIATETLDFVSREMSHPEGGFCSSFDADSEGEEGKYYTWTREQIRDALSTPEDVEFITAAYGLTDRGNWAGTTVLQRALDNATLAARFKLSPEAVGAKLIVCHLQLRATRDRRMRPALDDKILTSWNGLMLQAFAEAARVLNDDQKASQYLAVATRNADFLLAALRPKGELRRAWRAGSAVREVFLEDFGALALGLLDLYQTDFDNRWFAVACELAEEMVSRFSDPRGGFYDTPDSAGALLFRPKDLQDNATPSGNALACEALLRLAALSGDGQYRDRAERGLQLVANAVPLSPTSFARWLGAADFALDDDSEIAVLFDHGVSQSSPLLATVRGEYRPNTVVAAAQFPPSGDMPAVLMHRPLTDGKTTAYVCHRFHLRTAGELSGRTTKAALEEKALLQREPFCSTRISFPDLLAVPAAPHPPCRLDLHGSSGCLCRLRQPLCRCGLDQKAAQ